MSGHAMSLMTAQTAPGVWESSAANVVMSSCYLLQKRIWSELIPLLSTLSSLLFMVRTEKDFRFYHFNMAFIRILMQVCSETCNHHRISAPIWSLKVRDWITDVQLRGQSNCSHGELYHGKHVDLSCHYNRNKNLKTKMKVKSMFKT